MPHCPFAARARDLCCACVDPIAQSVPLASSAYFSLLVGVAQFAQLERVNNKCSVGLSLSLARLSVYSYIRSSLFIL